MIFFEILEKEEKNWVMALSNPGLSLLSHSKKSGPLYIPVENAICIRQISDRRH